MDMRSINHRANVAQWQERISECRRSGKTVRSWCQENSVLESTYYYWLKVVRNEILALSGIEAAPSRTQFSEVLVNNSSYNEHAISAGEETCAILQAGKFTVRINNGANPITIKTKKLPNESSLQTIYMWYNTDKDS